MKESQYKCSIVQNRIYKEILRRVDKMTLAAPAINIDVKWIKTETKIRDDENGFADDSAEALMPDVSKYIRESSK